MKTRLKPLMIACLCLAGMLNLLSCDEDEGPQLTGDSKTYELSSVSDQSVSGQVTFAKRSDEKTVITIELTGTQDGNSHPAHIHANTAAEGGSIVLDLTNVEGATGKSETVVDALNDGTPLTYEQLLEFDGYVNVHESAANLGALVAQGDIGQNVLTAESEDYDLSSVTDPGVSGTATFTRRENNETLVTVQLTGTADGGDHPSHIHANSAARGGGILIDLSNVDGATGTAKTNISQLNDGTPVTYQELLDFNGYINVHMSGDNLGTLIAQGDIGQNELTGDEEVYQLTPVADPTVTGVATFSERRNGKTLVTVALTGTQAGASHPSHIHANTIAETGGIVIDLKNVDGTTGMARTSVDTLRDGTPITYDELLEFNGYLNVHTGGTFVAQGDIGQNALTGESVEYVLNEVASSGVSGTATFAERKSGFTLITINLVGTTAGADHPSHIHANDAATGGGIVVNLASINGTTGTSMTHVTALNDNTAITYAELVDYNGYINVHLSASQLATLIAQGNIGSNAN